MRGGLAFRMAFKMVFRENAKSPIVSHSLQWTASKSAQMLKQLRDANNVIKWRKLLERARRKASMGGARHWIRWNGKFICKVCIWNPRQLAEPFSPTTPRKDPDEPGNGRSTRLIENSRPPRNAADWNNNSPKQICNMWCANKSWTKTRRHPFC